MAINIYGTKSKDKIEQDASSFPKPGEFRPNIYGLEGDDTIIAYQANVIGGAGDDVLVAKKITDADYAVLSYRDSPVILPFCKGARSRNVMQPWPVSASV